MKSFFLIFVMLTMALRTMPLMAQEELIISGIKGSAAAENVVTKILEEAYKRIGIKAIIKLVPGERALQMSGEGVVDGEAARFPGVMKNYPNLLKIPVPILRTTRRTLDMQSSLLAGICLDVFSFTRVASPSLQPRQVRRFVPRPISELFLHP